MNLMLLFFLSFFFHFFFNSVWFHKVNKTKWNCAFGIRAPLALIKMRVIFCADTIFSVTIFSLVCSPIAKWDVTVLYDCTYIWKFHSRLCAPALLSWIHFSWVLWNQIEMVYLVNLMGTETGLKQPKPPIIEALQRHNMVWNISQHTLFYSYFNLSFNLQSWCLQKSNNVGGIYFTYRFLSAKFGWCAWMYHCKNPQ